MTQHTLAADNSSAVPEKFCLLTALSSDGSSSLYQRSYPKQLAGFEVQSVLQHEEAILRHLNGEGVSRLSAVDHQAKTLTIATDVSLKLHELVINELVPEQWLDIAIALAQSLNKVHAREVVHLGLRPGVFLLAETLDYAELVDLSSARRLSKESSGIKPFRPQYTDPHFLAPEQGFQQVHSLDTRTDLYSLGTVLYWLVSGQRPFADRDKAEELSYAHIALDISSPTLPAQGKTGQLAAAFYKVVATLLEKEPAERYQSCVALLHDLQTLKGARAEQLAEFIPAQQNIPDRLFIPEKLYGREEEARKLLDAFHRVEQGPSEALLVAGYSGVGKSALVYEVQQPILRANGLFVWGKFDQYQGASPYSAISQAFNHFIRSILAQPPEQVEFWRQRLLEALTPNAQILIDILPDLSQLLGPQPEPSPLGPEEQQNRFNTVFLRFVHAICTQHKPLVVFIDDLQWADLASINLLKLLFSDESSQHCLILGAYRDNEVDSRHPFMQMLTALDQDTQRLDQLTLQPLQLHSVQQLIADSLKQSPTQVSDLAALVYEKTAGNPFFFRQFLQELYQSGLLAFNHQQQGWGWSLEDIRKRDITDNVVDLMVEKISRLPEQSQQLLQQASCIGAVCSTSLLRELQADQSLYLEALNPVLNQGLLYRDGGDTSDNPQLRFLHDRVQQAAYSLIDSDQRTVLHYRLGGLLLRPLSYTVWKENSYELLNHFNQAHQLLTAEQRPVVAELNLMAAERARDATAYSLAVDYLDQYFLLNEGANKQIAQYCHAALLRLEVLYLSGDFERAEKYQAEVKSYCDTPESQLRLQVILITQYTRYGELELAISEGLAGLKQLGNPLPDAPDMNTVGEHLAHVQMLLKSTSFAELVEQPEISDKRVLRILELLMAMQPCCYNSGSILFPLTILELLRLTITQGNSAHSSYVYMMYGLFCTKVLKDYPTAFAAEKYSNIAGERFPSIPLVEGRLRMMRANFILPWKGSLLESGKERDQAYHACLEQGDYYWGVHAYIFGFYADLFCCDRLDSLLARSQQVVATCRKIKQPAQVYLSQLQTNLIQILKGELDNQHNLDHQAGYEQEALEHFTVNNYMCGKYDRLLGRLLQAYLFGNYQQGVEIALSEELTPADLDEGIFHEAAYTLFNILSLLAMQQKGIELKAHWQSWLKTALEKFYAWEAINPGSFAPAGHLVRAEQRRLQSAGSSVLIHYEAAIETAGEAGFPLLQALSNERMANYRQQSGQLQLAEAYLRESIRLYQAWGALAKVAEVRQQLAALKEEQTPAADINVDWQTVLKASQQLSQSLPDEPHYSRLLSWSARITGAQSLSLYSFEEGGEWSVLARFSEGKISPLPKAEPYPHSVLNYCLNSRGQLLLKNARQEGDFILDPYVIYRGVQSLLALPLIFDSEVNGVLLLEHNQTPGMFTAHQIDLLELLISQYLISSSNAELYNSLQQSNLQLEDEVSSRTSELQRKSDHLEAIQAALPLPYALTRMDGSLVSANTLFCDQFGLDQSDLNSSNVFSLYASYADRERMLESLRHNYSITNFECELKTPQGEPFWAQFSSTLIQLEDEKAIFSVISDISERKKKESLLHKQANTDPLTGVLNRRAFLNFCDDKHFLQKAGTKVLAMLDLDHFKRLNDSYGHAAGDEVLKGFTTLVSGLLRDADLFGRIGGEEFVVVLSDVDEDQAGTILERIRSELENSIFYFQEQEIGVTVSIGATFWPSGNTVSEAMQQADEALYNAKGQGRNRIIL